MLHIKFPEKSVLRFWSRRFLKVFTIYGRGGHLGHVNRISFPLPKEAPHKIWFDWPSGFGEEDL